jgi:uncharacterized protein with ParB-like and HNH nuclease domain
MNDEANLLEELNIGRKEIKTDSYSMSIGEIINLYKEGELELTPAYQRLFRWEDEHKSKFIESILLGIPLPPIFVAQKEGGKWSIVDGLQRISTILQLTGELDDKPPLRLTTTKKLPSLDGFTWETLPEDVRRILKRAKFGVNIILTENSIQAQYELFQRLNTGGLHLEPQEIRNCLIIMLDEKFYEKINELKEYDSFKQSLDLLPGKFDIEYHMELILRFFISKFNHIDYKKYKTSSALLSEFIDNETMNLIANSEFHIDDEINIFKRTFDLLFKVFGNKVFKKFNPEKNIFEGAFSNSCFEAITSGVASNIDVFESKPEELQTKVMNLFKQPDFLEFSKRGNKALYRIKGMSEFSKKYFSV